MRQENIGSKASQSCIKKAAKHHVRSSNCLGHSKHVGLSQDQAKSINCSLQETVTCQCDLDVGILADVLNTVLKKPQQVTCRDDNHFKEGIHFS